MNRECPGEGCQGCSGCRGAPDGGGGFNQCPPETENPKVLSYKETQDQATDSEGFRYTRMPRLTKREYFAAMALQGLCIAENRDMPKTAAVAVAYADALIAELSKAKP